MSTQLVLSIIIPSFEQAHHLYGALESIKEQDFNNFEVIVVDGGSKDNTAEVVRSFFGSMLIHFYSEPDNGIYDAMNKGIDRSAGEFIYFMGCDDRLASPSVLQDIFSHNHGNYDFIYGDVIFTLNATRYDGPFSKLKLMSKNICHQGIFVKQSIFKKMGKFNVNYKYLADWEFNMKCFSSKEVSKKYLPIVIAYYNNNGSSFNNEDVEFSKDRNLNHKKYFSLFIRLLHKRQGMFYRLLYNYL